LALVVLESLPPPLREIRTAATMPTTIIPKTARMIQRWSVFAPIDVEA